MGYVDLRILKNMLWMGSKQVDGRGFDKLENRLSNLLVSIV